MSRNGNEGPFRPFPFPFPTQYFNFQTISISDPKNEMGLYPQTSSNPPRMHKSTFLAKLRRFSRQSPTNIIKRWSIPKITFPKFAEEPGWKWKWSKFGNGNGLEMVQTDHFHFHHFHFWTSKENIITLSLLVGSFKYPRLDSALTSSIYIRSLIVTCI